jgi:transposase
MSGQVNKTDKNDAYGLAQIVKAGWYREVGVKSLDSRMVRSMLGARAQLVGMRVEVTNQIRVSSRHSASSYQDERASLSNV